MGNWVSSAPVVRDLENRTKRLELENLQLRERVFLLAEKVRQLEKLKLWEERLLALAARDQRVIKKLYYENVRLASSQKAA